MYGRGRHSGSRPPPINHGCVQVLQNPQEAWQHSAWQPLPAPVVYSQLNAAPLHTLPGITLQPIQIQPTAYAAVPIQQGSLQQFGVAQGPPQWSRERQEPLQQWQQRLPSPGGRGFLNGNLHPPGMRPQGRGGPPPGRGGPPPARGGGREHFRADSHAGGGLDFRGQRVVPAVAPKASFEKQQGTSGKNAKRMRKAMQQLEQEENAPKKAKTYTSAEIAEGVKWQEDRRKNFPTETNLERKAEEAKKRAERGEVDLEEQDKRKALKTVLQLQRKLGLSKAAGTDAMSIDGPPKGFQGRGRGGRGSRGGRGRGRSERVEYHIPPTPGTPPAEEPQTISPELMLPRGGPGTPVQSPRANAADIDEENGPSKDLLGLGGYDSQNDDSQAALGAVQATVGKTGIGADAVPDKPEQLTAQPLGLHEAADVQNKASRMQPPIIGNGLGEQRREPKRKRKAKAPKECTSHRQPQQSTPSKPSLLQRLLAKEIRQERSLLLQTFRFMVNNNFLQDFGRTPLVFHHDADLIQDEKTKLRDALKKDDDIADSDDNSEDGN